MTKAAIATIIILAIFTVAIMSQSIASVSSGKTVVKSGEIGRYFLDPRTHEQNFGYCGSTPSFTFTNILTKTVSPTTVKSGANAAFTIKVTVASGTTGIVQDFLPSGFTFVAGTFKIDGVKVTPTVNDGAVQFNNLKPGTHTIVFTARAPATFFSFRSFDTARAFIIRNGQVVQFSAFQFLVTVRGSFG